jgi:uncharacterized protein (TIGR03435 family)
VRIDGSRFEVKFLPLTSMIAMAYKLKPQQISGPDWMNAQLFEIHAKLPEGSNKEQLPEMMQSLLEERFQLAYHNEKKEMPIYALIVAKGGHKLKEAAEDPAPAPDAEKKPAAKTDADKKDVLSIQTPEGEMKVKQEDRGMSMDAGKAGKMKMIMGENGNMNMEFSKLPMSEFASLLAQFTDRPVEDMTELKGTYQISLEIPLQELMGLAKKMFPEVAALAGSATPGSAAPASGIAGVTASDPSSGGIEQAVQKLGLKLEPRKVPADTMIVDHIEKSPTEN